MFRTFSSTVLLISLFTTGQCDTSKISSFRGEGSTLKELTSQTRDNSFTIVPLIPLISGFVPGESEAIGVVADFGANYTRDNNLTSSPNMFIRISSNEALLVNPDHEPRYAGLDSF